MSILVTGASGFVGAALCESLVARGERWGPYRTYAAQYLWRIADFGTEAKAPTKRSQD